MSIKPSSLYVYLQNIWNSWGRAGNIQILLKWLIVSKAQFEGCLGVRALYLYNKVLYLENDMCLVHLKGICFRGRLQITSMGKQKGVLFSCIRRYLCVSLCKVIRLKFLRINDVVEESSYISFPSLFALAELKEVRLIASCKQSGE